MIEDLDKSHRAGDHFNREVSASCRTVRSLSIFKQCVGICGHLIACSVPVELAGGVLM